MRESLTTTAHFADRHSNGTEKSHLTVAFLDPLSDRNPVDRDLRVRM